MNAELPALPEGYEKRMPRCREAEILWAVPGFGGRQIFLTPETAETWARMADEAERAGVPLLLLSGFRSMARQAEIIRRKLSEKQNWEDILRVSAYPGFSEHHTGCAVDIGAQGYEALTEEFETSGQFRWLSAYAGRFGFKLSYPRDNPCGITYEPWHWCLKDSPCGLGVLNLIGA